MAHGRSSWIKIRDILMEKQEKGKMLSTLPREFCGIYHIFYGGLSRHKIYI
jgi:hypothetical protein